MGDYFLPGMPFEGWDLEINGQRCQGYNTGSGSSTLITSAGTATGTNLSYAATGSKVSGTWQGMYDSVAITQITTLDTNDMYFTVKVILTNTAVAPKNNIYYLRSLDPDNDQSWLGGGFPTHNVIEYQSTDTSIVSATGYSSTSAYLALGTADTAATALIYNSWPIAIGSSLASAYSGTMSGEFTGPVGTDHAGDIAIGLIMYIPHLSTVDSAGDSVYRTTSVAATRHPKNSASFTYFYAFSKDAADSAIAHTILTYPAVTLGTISNVNSVADVRVYPNPSKDQITITGLAATDRVALYDMVGRSAGQDWVVSQDGASTFRYNNVPTGAYVVVVTDSSGNIKSRVPVRKN